MTPSNKAHDKNEIRHYVKHWEEITRPDNVEYPVSESQIQQYEELNNIYANQRVRTY